jgi:hypothetical protein
MCYLYTSSKDKPEYFVERICAGSVFGNLVKEKKLKYVGFKNKFISERHNVIVDWLETIERAFEIKVVKIDQADEELEFVRVKKKAFSGYVWEFPEHNYKWNIMHLAVLLARQPVENESSVGIKDVNNVKNPLRLTGEIPKDPLGKFLVLTNKRLFDRAAVHGLSLFNFARSVKGYSLYSFKLDRAIEDLRNKTDMLINDAANLGVVFAGYSPRKG